MQRSSGDAGVSNRESRRFGRSHLSRFIIGFARGKKTLLQVSRDRRQKCEAGCNLIYVMFICGLATSTFAWILDSCTSDTGKTLGFQLWLKIWWEKLLRSDLNLLRLGKTWRWEKHLQSFAFGLIRNSSFYSYHNFQLTNLSAVVAFGSCNRPESSLIRLL